MPVHAVGPHARALRVRSSRAAMRAVAASSLTLVALSLGGLSLGALSLAGCDSTPKPTSVNTVPTRVDGEWLIASVKVGEQMLSIPAGTASQVRMRFTSDPTGTGRTEVNGFAAVNRFFGAAIVGADGSFKMEGIGSTKMAGPPAAMSFENALLAALRDVESWSGESSGLVLVGSNSRIWMVPATAE